MNAGSQNLFQPISISVNNATAGQRIGVQLTPNGAPVSWSTGPAFRNIAGISVMAQSGVLPLTEFNINTGEVAFITTGSGGALNFNMGAFLVGGAQIETFFLRSFSDPGVEVTAAIGDTTPQAVNQTDTLFAWHPI
jgi:hypothetical protein